MKIEGKLEILSLIHKFEHGIRNLPHANWVSASGFRISLAGLLGAAGLILAARDGRIRKINCLPWASDGDSSLEKSWLVPGLQNLGNNCFLNVILQALASCSCFQSFLQQTAENCESLLGEEWVDSLPLTVSLASLMEELCTIQHGKMVLSPRKLMLVMDHYISNFNLANQQDAEEALFHILSSLREEASVRYVPIYSSLADVTAIHNCRILASKKRVEQSEQERWRQSFFGPFDGILGSNLTCESCSFQISLDFQFFHTLHLSPLLRRDANIITPGCSVEDCLENFFAAELLENYFCSHCWHVAAIRYLSLMEENESDIEKLRCCSEQGSCDCKNLPRLKGLPWSNKFSHTFKKLSIAHSPKILCIHLQRASMNGFGDLVKLQGHISFPLILNLYPFMNSGMGIKNWDKNLRTIQAKQLHRLHPKPFQSQLTTNVPHVYGQTGNNISEAVIMEGLGRTALEISGDTQGQPFEGEPSVPQNGGCLDTMFGNIPVESDYKVGGICHLAPPDMYRLVSVVEHFGRSGSGHYTVYRRLRAKNDTAPLVLWFGISDSDVHCVSETDVLAAEASLLFYEKISNESNIC